MAVSAEVVNGLQVVVADICLDGSELGIIESTTVNDNTFRGFVADYIAVLLKGIYGEYFNI